jgi:hypothetical protein
MSQNVEAQEFLYDSTIHWVETVDFGVDPYVVLSGHASVPLQDLRFTLKTYGTLSGPSLQGKLEGTTQILFGSNRTGISCVQAILTSPEGDRISFMADGFFSTARDGEAVPYRETARLYSASERYGWVNTLKGVATGSIDFPARRMTLKAVRPRVSSPSWAELGRFLQAMHTRD